MEKELFDMFSMILEVAFCLVMLFAGIWHSFVQGDVRLSYFSNMVVAFVAFMRFNSMAIYIIVASLIISYIGIRLLTRFYKEEREAKTDPYLDSQKIGILKDGLLLFENRIFVVKNAAYFGDLLHEDMQVKVLSTEDSYAIIKPLTEETSK